MKIKILWDTSISGAPAGFKADVKNAAAQLDAAILNPITTTIQVGWNEIGGTPMSPNSGGLEVLVGYLQIMDTVLPPRSMPRPYQV